MTRMKTDPNEERPLTEPAPEDHADDDDGDEDAYEDIHVRDLWQISRFLGPFTRPHRRPLLLLALVLLLETILNFSFPLVTQHLVDEGLIQHNFDAVWMVLVYLGAAAVLGAVLGL